MGILDFKIRVYRSILDRVRRYETANPDVVKLAFKVVLFSDILSGDIIPLGYDDDDEVVTVGDPRKMSSCGDILIAGPPAMGKSWLGAQLTRMFDYYTVLELDHLFDSKVPLDDHGVKTPFLVNKDRLSKQLLSRERVLAVGTSNNMAEVLATIDLDCVIFPVPPLTVFVAAQKARADYYATKGDSFSKLVSACQSNAKMSSREYIKWVGDKIGLYLYRHFLLAGYAAVTADTQVLICFTPEKF
jgi:hypothetical protein